MDNIIVRDHDVLELEMLKKWLGVEFEIKDHDELRYFLGIELRSQRKGL